MGAERMGDLRPQRHPKLPGQEQRSLMELTWCWAEVGPETTKVPANLECSVHRPYSSTPAADRGPAVPVPSASVGFHTTCGSTHTLLHPHLTKHQSSQAWHEPTAAPLLPAVLTCVPPGAEGQAHCGFLVPTFPGAKGYFDDFCSVRWEEILGESCIKITDCFCMHRRRGEALLV